MEQRHRNSALYIWLSKCACQQRGNLEAIKLIDTDVDTFDLFYRINQLGVSRNEVRCRADEGSGGGSIINISGCRASRSVDPVCIFRIEVGGTWDDAISGFELARFKSAPTRCSQGVIDTPMNAPNPPGMNDVLVKTTPLRRMGESHEVAEAVLFLASPEASFATGAELAIRWRHVDLT